MEHCSYLEKYYEYYEYEIGKGAKLSCPKC